VRPNRFAVVRRTLFKLKQNRRKAIHGRLQYAIRLCTERRVSLEQSDAHDHANKRIMNMRAIRGQRRQWFCFCGRREASDMVSRPWLPIVLFSWAVWAWSWSSFKKRASCSNQPRVPSSRPGVAVVSTLRLCDGKPPTLTATSCGSAPE
jgi:hypothetical protein